METNVLLDNIYEVRDDRNSVIIDTTYDNKIVIRVYDLINDKVVRMVCSREFTEHTMVDLTNSITAHW